MYLSRGKLGRLGDPRLRPIGPARARDVWRKREHRSPGRFRTRSLGMTSAMVGTNLVWGPDPIQNPTVRRFAPGRWQAPIALNWGQPMPEPIPSSAGSLWNVGFLFGSSPMNPTGNAQALEAAQLLLQSNPSLLSQQQFNLLQQAGLIPSTISYSQIGQLSPTGGAQAIDPNTGLPYATELAEAQSAGATTAATASPTSSIGSILTQPDPILGLPIWLDLVVGGGLFFILSGSGGGRRR